MLPTVTIFMPTYNHENLISMAIESALNQGYEKVEILIGDDCSTDRTWEIVSTYANKYPAKIKAFRNPANLGITGNCNAILEKATGEYIAFTAGDDLVVAGRIEKQLQWFEENPDAVLCSSGVHVKEFESGVDLGIHHDHDFLDRRSPSKIFSQQNQLATARFMLNWKKCRHLRYDVRTPTVSDWLFFNEAILIGPYGGIKDVGTIYHRHRNNATARGVKRAYLDDRLIATDILLARYHKYYLSIRRQRSHIFYGMARRFFAENDMRNSLRFSVYSLIEAPLFISKSWVMLPLLALRYIGVDVIRIYDRLKPFLWNKIFSRLP